VNINATLIGQAIAFAVFVWFCMKFVWPPIIAALEERQKKVEEGLNAADKAKQDLEQASAKVEQELKAAKAQAAALIEQANRRAVQLSEEAKQQAAAEAERILTQAKADIEQERASVRDALRLQVSALAVAGAEKILQTEIDANRHAEMLNKLSTELN
jgi:F-type H+-transporting ATPase subunit b